MLPLSKLPMDFDAEPRHDAASRCNCENFLRVGSAATLVAGGALLLTGNRRLGLVAATAGTTMAMIDQKKTIKKWWALLPDYLASVQRVLTQVEEAVNELAIQREKLAHLIEHEEEEFRAPAASVPLR
jgi:hypothetical protein